LLEDRDDLCLAELRLLHGTSWRGKDARKLYVSGVRDQGEVTHPQSLGETINVDGHGTFQLA
jgi:hypothetical protein